MSTTWTEPGRPPSSVLNEYPKKANAEIITGGWTFNAPVTLQMLGASDRPLLITKHPTANIGPFKYQDDLLNSLIAIGNSGTILQTPVNTAHGPLLLQIIANPNSLGVITRAAVGQVNDMHQWQNSAGTPVASVNFTGVGVFSGLTVANVNAGTGVGLLVQTGAAANAQGLVVSAPNQSVCSFILRAGAGQTADLLQVQNSSGAALAAVNTSGGGLFNGLSAYTAVGSAGQTFNITNGTQHKFFRMNGLTLEVINSAFTTALLQLNDTGILTTGNSIQSGFNGSNGYTLLSPGGPSNAGYLALYQPNQIRAGFIGFGAGSNTTIDTGTIGYTAGRHDFSGTVPSVITVVTKAAASQTVDIQQWQNSSGTALVAIQSNGGGYFAGPIAVGNPTFASATAGSNGALPAQVAGYVQVVIGGSAVKLPYYNN